MTGISLCGRGQWLCLRSGTFKTYLKGKQAILLLQEQVLEIWIQGLSGNETAPVFIIL